MEDREGPSNTLTLAALDVYFFFNSPLHIFTTFFFQCRSEARINGLRFPQSVQVNQPVSADWLILGADWSTAMVSASWFHISCFHTAGAFCLPGVLGWGSSFYVSSCFLTSLVLRYLRVFFLQHFQGSCAQLYSR